VKTVSRAIVSSLFLSLLGLVPAAARGQSVVLTHDGTLYADGEEKPLKAPEGVACTDGGHLVVADTGNKRLVLYTSQNGRLGGGKEVKLDQLTAPQRVQIDAKGDLYAFDLKTRKVVRVTANGSYGGTILVKGIENASDVVPSTFKLDPGGNVYLLDGAGHRVLVLDPSGTVTRQVQLPPESGTVTDIAVGAGGVLYAVDAVKAVVWSAEKGAAAFKPLTQSLKDRMSFPSYLTVSKGRIFVVDQNGNGIVVLGVDGSYQGRQLSIGWGEGLVYYPAQLCMTESGTVFVADRYNNRVQVFSIAK
jgi:NHL repeat-containing protein